MRWTERSKASQQSEQERVRERRDLLNSARRQGGTVSHRTLDGVKREPPKPTGRLSKRDPRQQTIPRGNVLSYALYDETTTWEAMLRRGLMSKDKAREQLQLPFPEPEPCEKCNGQGQWYVLVGATDVDVDVCDACEGTGQSKKVTNTLTCMWCAAEFHDIVILEDHEDDCC